METKNSILVNLVLKLAQCEADYIRGATKRQKLETRLGEIRSEYEKYESQYTKSDTNYISILLLFLERIKKSLYLEDEIMKIIEHESNRFNMNINRVLEDLKLSFKNLQKFSTQDTGSGSVDSSVKAKRANYPKQISHILKKWLQENSKNPYPSDTEKAILREKTGLDTTQLNNWFINARRRILPFLRESTLSKEQRPT